MDNIELKELDDAIVKQDRKLSSNSIRFRDVSFSSILNKYNNFRLKKSEEKLLNMKMNLMEKSYTGDSEEVEKEIKKDVDKVVKLENKIALLSKNEIPSVKKASRAIKLRNNMMNNLGRNGDKLYIGYSKTFDIFPETENQLPKTDDEIKKEQENNLKYQEMEAGLVNYLDKMDEKQKEEEQELTDEDMEAMVEEKANALLNQPEIKEDTELSEEEISTIVDQTQEAVNKAMNNSNEDTAKQENNTEFYDFSGNIREHDYKPLSQEEIEASKDKIKEENDYDNVASVDANDAVDTNVVPIDTIVVPERVIEETKENENIGFDYSDATENDVKNVLENNTELTISDYERLKKRIAELQEQQRKSKEETLAAEKEANKAADEVAKIKETKAEKDEDLAKRIKDLKIYSEAIEADIEVNKQRTRTYNESTERNRKLVEEGQQEIANIDSQLAEIDSLIPQFEESEENTIRR